MSRLCRLWAIEPRVRSASGCGRSLSFLYAEAIADEWTEIVATVDHAWALVLDAPLFFANARTFRDQIRLLAQPRPARAGS